MGSAHTFAPRGGRKTQHRPTSQQRRRRLYRTQVLGRAVVNTYPKPHRCAAMNAPPSLPLAGDIEFGKADPRLCFVWHACAAAQGRAVGPRDLAATRGRPISEHVIRGVGSAVTVLQPLFQKFRRALAASLPTERSKGHQFFGKVVFLCFPQNELYTRSCTTAVIGCRQHVENKNQQQAAGSEPLPRL